MIGNICLRKRMILKYTWERMVFGEVVNKEICYVVVSVSEGKIA